jgi:signal peptidase II
MDQAPDQPSSSSPPPEATPALDQRWRGKWLALAIITVVCVGLDQGTKHWAQTDLQHRLTRRVTLVEGYLALSYVRNPGAAWGFLARANKSFRRPFFIGISIIAMLFILYLFRKLEPGQHLMMTALSLVMGGAIGNFIDRIRFNYVVDFIDFHIQRRFKWPTFNVADIAITIGVLLLFLEMFILPRVRRRRQRAASAHAVAAEGEAKDPGEGV